MKVTIKVGNSTSLCAFHHNRCTNDCLTGSILYDAIYIYLLCTSYGANSTERRAHQ